MTEDTVDVPPPPERVTYSATESDPRGLDQHTPGAKLDAGKIRASLVVGGFPLAILEVAKVATYGANKYTAGGWQHVENGVERYTDAMLRHYLSESSGELRDKESDLLHSAQVAWNALARLELLLRGNS